MEPPGGGAADDFNRNLYSRIVRYEPGQFIVGILEANKELDWETTSAYDAIEFSDADKSKQSEVFGKAAVLEVIPTEGISELNQLAFLRLLGEALVCNLENQHIAARAILNDAEKFVTDRGAEISRRWYLYACCRTALWALIPGALVWLTRADAAKFISPDGVWILCGASLGALGALLSVIQRSGKLEFTPAAGRQLHYLEGTSRVLAGVISGLIVSFAVRYGLVLGSLASTTNLHGMILLSGLVAGTGERFATSIITTVGGSPKNALNDKSEHGRSQPRPQNDSARPS